MYNKLQRGVKLRTRQGTEVKRIGRKQHKTKKEYKTENSVHKERKNRVRDSPEAGIRVKKRRNKSKAGDTYQKK